MCHGLGQAMLFTLPIYDLFTLCQAVSIQISRSLPLGGGRWPHSREMEPYKGSISRWT